MRLQITTLLILLFSLSSFASDDKAMKELFEKYDKVMDEKKVDLVDDVFSKKFLKDAGGKESFTSSVKAMAPEKNNPKMKVTWRKTQVPTRFMATLSPETKTKDAPHVPEFIVVKEDGKLKIDGTIGDAE